MYIWQRLLWREYRESAPYMLIGVSLPLLCLAFPKFRGELVFLPISVIILMIAVWAVERAQEEKRCNSLPISAPWRFASHYLLPLLSVISIALSNGVLLAFRLHTLVQLDYILFILAICVVVYLLCMVVSSVFPLLPALLLLMGCGIASSGLYWNPYAFEYKWLLLRLLIAALITAVFWEGFRGKQRVVIVRIALPLLIVIAVSWGMIMYNDISNLYDDISYRIKSSSYSDKSIAPVIIVWSGLGNDGTLRMDFDRTHRNMITLRDERVPQSYSIKPDRISQPGDYIRSLNSLDRRVVLFAVQAPNDAIVRIMAWDAPTGQVCERFRFSSWRGMMKGDCYARISPTNRYLLMGVDSKIVMGADFWLLDLQHKRATMVLPNVDGSQYYNDKFSALSEAIWSPNRVIVRSERRYLSVDLQTLHVTNLRIGGKQ